MSKQIFEIASVHGIRVMGIADTDDHRVRASYIDAPFPKSYGDTEEEGQMTGRQMMALGHVLIELGSGMLGGDIRHDANKGRPRE